MKKTERLAPSAVSSVIKKRISRRLRRWYHTHGRDLRWRRTRDPYRIWVSEIMLQQTQVETVTPYYRRWLKRFPTIRTLAGAPLRDVLAIWEGLGYYSRARNMHRAAQKIVAEHGGRLPRDMDSLRRLPGIGRYTAAAIASIAFNADEAVLDGNVRRVLARVFNLTDDIKSAKVEKKLWGLAQSLLPPGQAADHNQALMDLGATICKPKKPACSVCPLLGVCRAQRLGVQNQRPVAKKAKAAPHYHAAAGVIRKSSSGRILIAQRPPDKLLGGLWEFPGGKRERNESLADCLKREIREELGIEISVGQKRLTVKHAFTHFRITLHVFDARWMSGRPKAIEAADYKWVKADELSDYPMGKMDRAIAEVLNT